MQSSRPLWRHTSNDEVARNPEMVSHIKGNAMPGGVQRLRARVSVSRPWASRQQEGSRRWKRSLRTLHILWSCAALKTTAWRTFGREEREYARAQ